jgi:hypothetical protein
MVFLFCGLLYDRRLLRKQTRARNVVVSFSPVITQLLRIILLAVVDIVTSELSIPHFLCSVVCLKLGASLTSGGRNNMFT